MKIANRLRIGPIARLSLGLVALLVSLVMVADMLLGVVPEFGHSEREVRRRVAENLVIQISTLLESGDTVALNRTLQQVLARDPSIASITVRRTDGLLALHRGQPLPSATATADAGAAGNRLRIPIYAGRQVWGEVDLRFASASAAGLAERPWLQLLGALALGGFALSYAYLRRAMQYLNPSASVPDRVRKAFDSLAEGLVIVDQRARIVLANRAFRKLHPQAEGDLNGQSIDTLDWLAQAIAATGGAHGKAEPAWNRTLQTGEAVDGRPLELPRPEGGSVHLLVSSSAITDGSGRARGCLITFDNVTAVHTANADLRNALDQLESSQRRVAEQNDELRQLALRDPLTGCYNRRALFQLAGDTFSLSLEKRQPLCCLMVDIDHFKQFNDLYGHAVGDQVIQVVSRLLTECLRENDVLGRYGGEEFCIVLPATGSRTALEVAERMRVRIESEARTAILGVEVMPITASFGVASLSAAAQSIEGLIDQADQALYASKQSGRNRATLWQPPSPLFTRPAELALF